MFANYQITAFGQCRNNKVNENSLRNALLIALLILSYGYASAEERKVERTLETQNGVVELSIVDGTGATTDISTGEPGRVVVEATISGFLSRWGQSKLRKQVVELLQNPPIKQAGNNIQVGNLPWRIRKDLSISYRISVPPNTNVHAVGSETVRVHGLTGNLHVTSATTIASEIRGDVTLKRAQSVRVNAVSGNLTVSGGRVVASDIEGDVHITRAELVSIENVGGKVTVTDRAHIVNVDDMLVDLDMPNF